MATLEKEKISFKEKRLMVRGDDPYKVVGYLTPYIEDEDKRNEDLTTNPLQG